MNSLRGRDVVRARLTVLYDEKAPESLVAKALPPLARDGFLPPNDIAGFLENASPLVRAAAVMSFNPTRPLPTDVKDLVMARLDDEDADVRRAAFLAAGPLNLHEAVPRLIEKVKTAKDEDRTSLLHTLFALPDPRALPHYMTAIGDADPSLNRAGILRCWPFARRLSPKSDGSRAKAACPPTPLRPSIGCLPVSSRCDPGKFSARSLASLRPDCTRRLDRRHAELPWGSWKTGNLATFDPKDDSGRIELLPLFGGEVQQPPGELTAPLDAAAYAEIDSTTDRRAIFLIRSSGLFDLFVNGTPVSADPKSRDGRDYFEGRLVQGANRLLIATRQGESGWEFELLISATGDESVEATSRSE